MFKTVEYVGFESHPDLKAKAEQLTPVLANEIRASRDVEVLWTPQPNDPDRNLNLTLSRTLTNGVQGSALGTFTPDDLGEAWLTRSRCRAVWSDLLEDLSQKLDARLREALSEETPGEVTEATAERGMLASDVTSVHVISKRKVARATAGVRILEGVVTRDKMNRTRRVEVQRLVRHPKYGKFVKRRTVCYVHDEKNESHLGDTVEIIESCPHSKTKRWSLVKIVKKAPSRTLSNLEGAVVPGTEASAPAVLKSEK